MAADSQALFSLDSSHAMRHARKVRNFVGSDPNTLTIERDNLPCKNDGSVWLRWEAERQPYGLVTYAPEAKAPTSTAAFTSEH